MVAVLTRDHAKKGVPMQSNTCSHALPLPVPFLFSPLSLYARLLTLTDRRDPRGVRYPLAALLTIAALAKLAAHDSPRAIADWARLRAPMLTDLFGLHRPTMPHPTTWNRILGSAVDPQQFAAVVADFLITASTMTTRDRRVRGQIALCLDGKTLRGTIPAGASHGTHLLCAYLPDQGIALVEVAVATKENEIVVAKAVLATLDVRGCVLTGDAMFAQRELSQQVRDGKGDYLWCVKENQHTLHAAIATLFATPPQPVRDDDFSVAQSIDTAHGRYEQRRLTASGALAGYSDWPHAAQVFRVERRRWLCGGGMRGEVAYGVTSLPAAIADAARLLALVRGHWQIENGLFYRRDATLDEDRSLLRQGDGPQILATLNDLTVGIALRDGHTNVAAARRFYAAFPEQAFNLLTAS
jgi:predicted transposase YbfD/YdcC